MKPSLSVSVVSAALLTTGAVILGVIRRRTRQPSLASGGPSAPLPPPHTPSSEGRPAPFDDGDTLIDRLRQRGF